MSETIVSRLKEDRKFQPSAELRRPRACSRTGRVPRALPEVDRAAGGVLARRNEGPRVAKDRGTSSPSGSLPKAKFFVGAKLNVTESCLDRHLTTDGPHARGARVGRRAGRRPHPHVLRAPPRGRALLGGARRPRRQGRRPRRHLHGHGARDGRSPCWRARASGATHSVVFGGFSSDALRDRINDCKAKVLLTQDAAWRRGNVVPLKQHGRQGPRADADDREGRRLQAHRRGARAGEHEGRSRRVVDRRSCRGTRRTRRRSSPSTPRPSTPSTRSSSSTRRARPASRRASCTPPRATSQARTSRRSTSSICRTSDLYWCTADVGWVTGHSYIVYGPLSCGASVPDVRGRAQLPRLGSLLEHHRAARRLRSSTRRRRRFAPSSARATSGRRSTISSSLRLLGQRRRAHQPRGVGLVPHGHRRRALPHRRHLVADRDGQRHADHPARRRVLEAGRDGPALLRLRHRHREGRRHGVRSERRRQARHQAPLALDGAHALRRRRALQDTPTGRSCPACTSPATARAATRTATSGSSAASTTCSTWPGIASAPPRSRARS